MHARPRPRRTLEAVTFRPPRALGVIVGGAFVAWALVFAALAGQVAFGAVAEFKTFLAWLLCVALTLVAAVFATWTYSLLSLRYTIDRDALTIVWGLRRVVVPIDTIQRMAPGRTIDAGHISGLNWWGCHVGSADVKRIGYTIFYSTHTSPEDQLFIVTTAESYALTVLDQAAFAEEVQARAALGPVAARSQRSAAIGIAAIPFWRDRVAIAAAAFSTAAAIGFYAYLFARYPGLPNVIQLNFPALGGVVRVGDKAELLRTVYLGAGILVANVAVGVALHARERAAGLWLLASGGMLQAVLLAAAVVAVERS